MHEVEWTKTFAVHADKRNFRILLTQRADGYYGSCLYYRGDRALKAPGSPGGIEFKLETCFGNSESEAFSQIVDWAKAKFGEDIEIEPL